MVYPHGTANNSQQWCVFVKQANADWWRGENSTGQQGIFPSNYVRKLEESNRGYSDEKVAAPSQYPQHHAPPYVQPQMPQQQQQQQQQQPEEKKTSKLGQFGKNYGRTFVNATAWYIPL